MNTCIKLVNEKLKNHPKLKQWLWFITLWCGGLSTVLVLSQLVKFMMRGAI
ncbi:MAG: hypothetical protein N4A31_00500 [Rickettsiales bacterium]|nr:hypothetical protein [Rickettsiales bacterium]